MKDSTTDNQYFGISREILLRAICSNLIMESELLSCPGGVHMEMLQKKDKSRAYSIPGTPGQTARVSDQEAIVSCSFIPYCSCFFPDEQ
jgi:hypothetical protein